MGVIIEAETQPLSLLPHSPHFPPPICSTLKRQNPSTFRSICAHNELPDGAGRGLQGVAVCRALEQQRAKKITKVFELTSAIKIEAELNLLCQVLAATRRSSEGGIHWER